MKKTIFSILILLTWVFAPFTIYGDDAVTVLPDDMSKEQAFQYATSGNIQVGDDSGSQLDSSGYNFVVSGYGQETEAKVVFLRYDISALSEVDIEKVQCVFTVAKTLTNLNYRLRIHEVTGNWNNSVVSSTRPDFNSGPFAVGGILAESNNLVYTDSYTRYPANYAIDITQYIISAKANGKTAVNLALTTSASIDYGELYIKMPIYLFVSTLKPANADVDFLSSTAHIYGKIGDGGNVNLVVYKGDSEDINNLTQMEQMKFIDKYFDFKFVMEGKTGEYTAIISDGENRLSVNYNYVNLADIDNYTTEKITPWMVHYHLTALDQIGQGYHGGEAGQHTWSMAVAPSDPNYLVVGTDTNGIWRSVNGGESWKSCNYGFNVFGCADFAYDPQNAQIVYAAGSSGHFNDLNSAPIPVKNSGLYKSKNGGSTWTQILSVPYYRTRLSNLLKICGDKIYFAGHQQGVLISRDGGNSWVSLGLTDKFINSLLVTETQIVVTTAESGILISLDDGVTWTNKNSGLNSTNIYSVAISPNDGMHWLCNSGNEIYESVDGGQNWELVNSHSSTDYEYQSLAFGQNETLYLLSDLRQYSLRYSIDYGRNFLLPNIHNEDAFMHDNWGYGAEPFVIYPNDKNLMWMSFSGELYKSTDGGRNFFPSSSGYSGVRVQDFLFDPNDDNNVFLGAIDRGIIKTNYTNNNEQYPAVDYSASEDSTGIRYNSCKSISGVARDPRNKNRLMIIVGPWSTNCVVKESLDGGITYSIVTGTENCDAGIVEFNSQNPDIIYAGKLVSYDNGVTWNQLNIMIKAMSPVDGNVLYGSDGTYLQKSVDAGISWSSLGIYEKGDQRYTADLIDKDTVYIGTFTKGYIKVTGSNAVRYTKEKVFGESGNWSIFSIAQDPKNPLHMVAGGANSINRDKSEGLYETFDGGETWRVIKGITGMIDIWLVEFHPNLPRAYISTSAGTFVYEYENYFVEDIGISATEGFNQIWNMKDKPIEFMVICAQYNNVNTLNDVQLQKYSLIPYEQINVLQQLKQETGKVFFWDNNLSPISHNENYISQYRRDLNSWK